MSIQSMGDPGLTESERLARTGTKFSSCLTESYFPYMLTLPATSIKNFSDFVKRNVMKNRRTSSFVTRVGLMKDKSKTGIEYSKCTFEVDSFLDPAKADMAYNYAQGIKAMVGMVSTEKQAPVEVDWDAEMTEEVM